MCVSFGAGNAFDPPGFEGLALLTQRLHANGITPRFPGGLRGTFPDALVNLYWGSALTCIVVPDEELERALHAEAARMAYLLHSLREEHVRAEVEYILHHGWTASHLPQNVERRLWGRERGSATEAGLRAIDLDEVRRFHQRYYTPANAIVSVVSRHSQEEVVALVRRHFDGVRGARGQREVPSAPERETAGPVQVNVSSSARRVGLYWRSPNHLSRDDLALDLVAAHLRRTLLRRLRPNVTWVQAEQLSRSGYSEFFLEVDAADEADLDALARDVRAAVLEMSETPLSEDELEAARNSFVARPPGPEERAANLASNTRAAGTLFPDESRLNRLEALTARDVQSAFRWLRAHGVTVRFGGQP